MSAIVSKRRRMSQLAGTGRISDSGLSRLLRKLNNLSMASIRGSSRRNITRSVELDLSRNTPYGTCIQTTVLEGGLEWSFIHPMAMMFTFCEVARSFAVLLAETLNANPCSPEAPWRMIWYCDEAIPGNVVAPDNQRKTHCVYWSFLEFGAQLLSRAVMWFLGSLIRSGVLKESVPGGISHIIKHMMMVMFGFVDATINIATSGCLVPLPDGSMQLIFARLHAFCGDEKAIKEVWNLKGASGLKICILCKNCISAQSSLANNRSLISASCADLSRFQPTSDELIFAIADRLYEPMMVGELKALQTSLGFNLNVHGVLRHVGLRQYIRPRNTAYDFFHNYFINGIVHLEVHMFLALANANYDWWFPNIHASFRTWKWPKSCPCAKHVFSPSRASACASVFKASGSETFSMYPVLRFLILLRFNAGEMAAQINSIMALFKILDGYCLMLQGVTPPLWQEHIENHMRLFQVAYPDRQVLPKHHYALHCVPAIRQFGFLITCWVHERKHRIFKNYADHVQTNQSFEASVSRSLLNAQLDDFEIESCFRRGTYLEEETLDINGEFSDLGPEFFVAKSCCINGMIISVGDVLWVDRGHGELAAGTCKMLLRRQAAFYTIVDMHQRAAGNIWRGPVLPDARALISVDRVKGPAIHKPIGNGGDKHILLTGALAYLV